MFCAPIIKKQDQPSNDEHTCKNKHCALSVVIGYLCFTIFIEVLMLLTIAGLFYYEYSASRQQIRTTPKPKTFERKVALLGGDVSVFVLIMMAIGGLIRVAGYIVDYTTYYWWLSKESVLFYKRLIPEADIDNILKEIKVNATSVTTDDEGKIEMKVDIGREQQKFNDVKDSLDGYVDEYNNANCCLNFIQPFVSPLNIVLCFIYFAMVATFIICFGFTVKENNFTDASTCWPCYIGIIAVVFLFITKLYQILVVTSSILLGIVFSINTVLFFPIPLVMCCCKSRRKVVENTFRNYFNYFKNHMVSFCKTL